VADYPNVTVSLLQDDVKKVIFAVLSLAILLPGTARGQYTHTDGVGEQVGQTVPGGLIFSDEKGEKVSLEQLTDKPSLISLVYFSCGSACPLLLGNLAAALGEMDIDPNDYRVITISFDDRDTPEIASEKKPNYLKAIGRPFPDTSWRFLTGDKKNIKELTDAVGFEFREERGGFSHPKTLIFLSRDRRIARYLYGRSFSDFDIKMAFREAAGRNGLNADSLALFCYYYDPGENRYVFNLLKASAAVLFLSILSSLTGLLLARRNRVNR